MIDKADRKTPRFSRTAAAEAMARRMIRESFENEHSLETGRIIGIAGGVCGGDILFHELCAEMGIDTRLLLALPANEFSARSVLHGNPGWVERYNRLVAKVELTNEEELPMWLRAKPRYEIWSRTTHWMLFNALSLNAKSLTLIALWDAGPLTVLAARRIWSNYPPSVVTRS